MNCLLERSKLSNKFISPIEKTIETLKAIKTKRYTKPVKAPWITFMYVWRYLQLMINNLRTPSSALFHRNSVNFYTRLHFALS